jgi:Ser/Thr protein kinase RdoA (MazF antagonist)
MDGSPAEGWEDELERWLGPFLARLRRKARGIGHPSTSRA